MRDRYFKREEFACPCGCGFDAVDEELHDVLLEVRETFGQPVRITSGCRCQEHNSTVGGAPKSQHVFGKAADIQVRGVETSVVSAFLEQQYPDKYGVGTAKTFVHVDVRDDRARRWTY